MTRERAAAWLWRLAPGVVVLLMCLYAYQALLVREPPLHADEAGHALPAARMALALRAGDWHGFLDRTIEDILWPFLHPWFLAAWFLAFGISTQAARTASLFALAAALTLLPVFVREVGRSDAERGPALALPPNLGWLSVAALLTSQFLWTLSCTVMSESLGMLLVIATLWTEAWIRRRGAFWPYVACGALSACAFLIKYSYGVPLTGALLLAQALRVRHAGLRPLAGVSIGIGVPVAAWAQLVLRFDPARIALLISYLRVNRDQGLRGLDGLLFYPRGLSETLGWPTAVVLILALCAAFARRPGRARLASMLFVVLTLALLVPHPNKQLRYLVPALPVMLTLAEVELAFRLARWRGPVPWATAAVALVLARNPLGPIRESARADAPFATAAQAVLDFMVARAPHDRSLLLLGSTGRLPHTVLAWEILVHEGREPDVDLLSFPGETGWDARYRTGYPSEMRPEYASILRDTLASGRFPVVITTEFGPASPFLPDWLAKWDAWRQNYVRAMQEQGVYVLRDEAAFPESDAKVRIYEKRAR